MINSVFCTVLARPNDNLIVEDNLASRLDGDNADQLSSSSSTLPPFPTLSLRDFTLGMRPEELNSLIEDEGYVYKKPDTPFEGYFYDRPANPMTFPPPTTASTTTTTTTEKIFELPDGSARIL